MRSRYDCGEARVIYLAPFAIAASLLLLAAIQQLPALAFAAIISFVTAALRPIVMNRIQNEVSDKIRATVLSFQSLLFALVAVVIEPILGYVADHSGLASAYTVSGICVDSLQWAAFLERPPLFSSIAPIPCPTSIVPKFRSVSSSTKTACQ